MRKHSPYLKVIDRWISAVETGSPEGDYGRVTIMADGPAGQRQITFGKHQTTEVGGNLKELVSTMLFSHSYSLSAFAREVIITFLNAELFSCADNEVLLSLLRELGPKSREVQDDFFSDKYSKPADKWAAKNGFILPLSILVIRDSFVHSGGIPMFLRKRFPATPPSKGDFHEEDWVIQYVSSRHQWLKHWGDGKSEKSRLLRASSYRTASLQHEIAEGNWFLTASIFVNKIKIS